ncbi:hypothetical protein GCM10009578_038640 [Streptomyces rhizosphaericus]
MPAKGKPPDVAGLSLRLAEWKGDPSHRWSGRQLIGIVAGRAIGYVEYYLHPRDEALEVVFLDVVEAFRGRGLASVLMDSLYAAHPVAWISHGPRTVSGAQWWNRYREPDAARNIHNRPPEEWARYFKATWVAADRARNAALNAYWGLEGNRSAEYRYDQRIEEEFQRHDRAFAPKRTTSWIDPHRQNLYAGHLTLLPPALHQYVHDSKHPADDRAHALLNHIGRGNIPRSRRHTGYWNHAPSLAFDDALHAELFLPPRWPGAPSATGASVQSAKPTDCYTHVVFHIHPLAPEVVRSYTPARTYLDFTDRRDIPIQLSGLSWRTADLNVLIHHADFRTPLSSAIHPEEPHLATEEYRNHFDEQGRSWPSASESLAAPELLERRAADLQAMAAKLSRLSPRFQAQRPNESPQDGQHPPQQPPGPAGPRPG